LAEDQSAALWIGTWHGGLDRIVKRVRSWGRSGEEL
jgi:hypothetical protein